MCGGAVKGEKEINKTTLISRKYSLKEIKEKYGLTEAQIPFGPCTNCYKKDIIDNANVRFDVNLSLAEDKLFNLHYLKYCNEISVRDVSTYCYVQDEHGSLIQKYYPQRLQIEEIVSKTQEELLEKTVYILRWNNWKSVFIHYKKWEQQGSKIIKTDAKKQLKLAYKNAYFRERIP